MSYSYSFSSLKGNLKSLGFGDIINYISDFPNRNGDFIFRIDETQENIDMKIKQHENDSIKPDINYIIKDIICTKYCKALVLVEPEVSSKKLVKALIQDTSEPNKYLLWAPVIEYLVADLKFDNSSELNTCIYEILADISENIDKNIIDIVVGNYGDANDYSDIKFTSTSGSSTNINIYLYFSVVKETMILEEKRYPSPPNRYGKRMIVYAYQDLITTKIDYDTWRRKWEFI